MNSILKALFGTNEVASEKPGEQSSELLHINQEIYKKSLELSERNKTLLILRKIDEIILSSVTDQNEIAQHVTSILVTEVDFPIVTIFMYDKDKAVLKRLALSHSSQTADSRVTNIPDESYITEISLADPDNLIAHAVSEIKVKSSNTLINSLLSKGSEDNAINIQKSSNIKSVFIYPLIARDLLLGAMVVCAQDEEQDLSEYNRDLLDRLVQVIGIAIDNALLYNQLQVANEKLKALDKLKDEFVSLASHELRTPMTAIKSYLWMTLQGDSGVLNEKQKLYIERAYSSVDRLIKLVNDMLNISRIESGRLTVEMQKVDMNKIVQEVIDEVNPRAAEIGVNVAIQPVPSLPLVLADTDKIKEVLFNLIGNSLKFTPAGGNITISFVQKDEYIETKVKDTGSGISPENISKLFQKFGMLPESYVVNQTASGTGLGLYICRSIIELHKGKIWAASEGQGKGSEFNFSLRVFSEEDFRKVDSSQKAETKESVEIIHTQI